MTLAGWRNTRQELGGKPLDLNVSEISVLVKLDLWVFRMNYSLKYLIDNVDI